MRITIAMIALASSMALATGAAAATKAKAPEKSLYERLGGALR